MNDLNAVENEKIHVNIKKFIICVFGGSSTGKTTLLRGLLCDLLLNSKFTICDAEGFKSKDRRMAAWYRTGRTKQGVVAIGTPGDSWDIIKANIEFFERHLHLWEEWFKNYTINGGRRLKKGQSSENFDKKKDRYVECPNEGEVPLILVTSARMPLDSYPRWDEIKDKYAVLNIPMDVDAWYFKNQKELTQGGLEWLLPIRLTGESLWDNIRYILINKKFKDYPNKVECKIDFKRVKASVSRDH